MLLPVALPILILIVPLADLVLAVVRRTRAGRSPFAPDKQHLHHRLLEIGHSHRRAVLIMWLWAGLIAFGTVFASLYTGPRVWIGDRADGRGHPRADVRAAGRAPARTAAGTGAGRLTGPGFDGLPDLVLVFTSTGQPSTKWPPER